MRNYKIKASRIEKGLTQDFVAKELGIAKPTYSLKENGKRQFTQNEMVSLSKMLEKSLDELFFTKKVNTNKTI